MNLQDLEQRLKQINELPLAAVCRKMELWNLMEQLIDIFVENGIPRHDFIHLVGLGMYGKIDQDCRDDGCWYDSLMSITQAAKLARSAEQGEKLERVFRLETENPSDWRDYLSEDELADAVSKLFKRSIQRRQLTEMLLQAGLLEVVSNLKAKRYRLTHLGKEYGTQNPRSWHRDVINLLEAKENEKADNRRFS